MLVHSEILLLALKLNNDKLKFMWPDLYKWFEKNRMRVGMHESKFKHGLISLFGNEKHRIDLTKCQIVRCQ